MLEMMKRALLAAIAVLLLSACAGTRYYPVEGTGAGRYYLADTPTSIVHYPATEASLFVYGLSPWWGYSYYSPYYYPYYFGVSYASWPYYSPWPYHSHWYGARSFWYPPYRYRHHRHPGHRPGDGATVAPPPVFTGPPAGVPVRGGQRLRVMDDRGLQRESRAGAAPAASGPRARGAGSWGAPAEPAAGGSFPARSEPGPGPVSRRHPRKHDQ